MKRPRIQPAAQIGDLVAPGWQVFMRGLYDRDNAQDIAREERGRILPDGQAWAVVVRDKNGRQWPGERGVKQFIAARVREVMQAGLSATEPMPAPVQLSLF